MGLKEDKTITDIVQAVRESDAKKTKGYDTQATVIRVEDGKAWVHIPGGVSETPAELTINAQPGDSVMVRLAGGRAFLLGNATSPPTDDATAKEALSNAADALQSAVSAKLAADSAEASAATASAAAQDAVETAEAVHDIAVQAQEDAETAKTNAQTAITNAAAAQAAADAAQTSADTAQAQAASATASANGALNGLSTVQDVIGVLDWAKDNATYTLTSDTDIEPGKTYWTRSGSGTEADPYVYNPVVTPVKADLGTYYEISGVDEAMADFINTHLALTDKGLYVLGGANQWKVLIAPDGVYIINDTGNVVAKYKDVITLGMDDGTESYQRLDYHSLQLIDKEGNVYFHVSDLRDRNDDYQATVTEYFTGDGSTYQFTVALPVSTPVSATDSTDPTNTAQRYGRNYYFSNPPSEGAEIIIVYKTLSASAKAFTFGARGSGAIGPYSMATGDATIASGRYSHSEGHETITKGAYSHSEGYRSVTNGDHSHAEGRETKANGGSSHSEGYMSIAQGAFSHAEGRYTSANGDSSHAEGYKTATDNLYAHAEGDETVALEIASHAEGGYTTAEGLFAHAQNLGTVAKQSGTAVGEYNETKNYSKKLVLHTFTNTEASLSELTLYPNLPVPSTPRFFYNGVEVSSYISYSTVSVDGGVTRLQRVDITKSSTLRFAEGDELSVLQGPVYDKFAFSVGNGTSDTARSNAFSVDWDGEMRPCLNNYQTSGNVDKTIYDALNSLGWLSDCVES